MKPRLLTIGAALGVLLQIGHGAEPAAPQTGSERDWWWPKQQIPSKLVALAARDFKLLARRDDIPGSETGTYHTLAQSVAGLAAQAVNRGDFDELVWIDPHTPSGAEWLERLQQRLDLRSRPGTGIWELIDRYHRQGVIRGYIVYRRESVSRRDRGPGNDGDQSVNAATMLAGMRQGILITAGMEKTARRLGLVKLADARTITPAETFARFENGLDDRRVLVQDPTMAFGRDLAIAHRLPVTYGTGAFTEALYARMPPGGLAIGWNNAAEIESITQSSRYGHVFIPSDWSPNMTVLSAGAASRPTVGGFAAPDRAAAGDETKEDRPRMGLMMSDGDNLQWLLSSFTHNSSFWGHPRRGSFPMGWGLPVADLIQTAPDVYDYLVETQTARDSMLVHLGYYYPDRFGSALDREGRERALRLLGARVESTLQRSGTRLLTLLARDPNSPAALESYRIIAESSPSLEAIFAVRYHPYEGGAGEIHRVVTDGGREIPVSTARYALWADTEDRPRAGDVDTLAEVILRDLRRGETVDHRWVSVHAWSSFEGADGRKARGLTPTFKLCETLSKRIRITSFERLASRPEKVDRSDD